MKISLGVKPLAFTTPVWIIGAYDQDGRPNMMAASWAGICCSQPPCVGVSLRKATHTFGCLTQRRAFTVNIPSEEQVVLADFVGMVSGRKLDKFAAAGVSPERSAVVDAPYVKECGLVLECRVIQIVEIGLHTQFIGEIMDIKAEQEILDAQGLPDLEKLKPFSYSPEIGSYHGLGRLLGRAFEIGKSIKS